MMRSLFLFFALMISAHVFAQQQVVLSGKVSNAAGFPVAFTSVYVKGTTQATSTNNNGYYHLKLAPGKYNIVYRCIGYKQLASAVEVTGNQIQNISLDKEDFELKQRAATDTGDPAVAIMRNTIQNRAKYLNEVKTYSCNVYIRGVQKLLSAPKTLLSRGVARQLQLNLKSNSILYMSETGSQFNFKSPDKYKDIMVSSKATGSYNPFNFNKAANLQVNFYKNMFGIEGLNARDFISPIADNAFTFYTYKLLGSTTEDGKVIDKIQVNPIDQREPVFNGNIYIVEGDWRIYSAHLYVTGKSNLNFVDTLNINQQYIPVGNNIWQPVQVAFTYSGDVLGFKYQGYILGSFSDYDLTAKFPPHYFNGEIEKITDATAKRDSAYWAQNRPVPLTTDEQRNYNFKDSILKRHETPAYLDSVEKSDNQFHWFSYIFFGDTVKHRLKNEVFTLNPLYDFLQYNTVEGWVIDARPTYTKHFNFGRQYTISPELRYGFDNKTFSINAAFRYTYDVVHQGAYYGKIGTGIYDINSVGSVGTLLNSLNSLYFKNNELKLYRSKDVMAGTQRQVARGLLLDGNLQYAIRDALQNTSNRTIRSLPDKEFTSNNPYIPYPPLSAPLLFNQSDALTLKLSATYTFDETYTSTPAGPVFDQSQYPKIKINYRKGINSLFGSDVDYDYADLQIYHDHINLGRYGYSSFLITTGDFFNKNSLTYPDYKWFKGNEGITFEPGIGGFHFLPNYTYTDGAFFEAHYEHNFSGFLFNKIPGVRTLKLDEIIGGNFLGQSGQPNYGEFYVGVQRFFFRIDYGVVRRGDGHLDQGIKLYYGL